MAPKRNEKDMWTSVSAITDADDCLRRWWLNKVVKLPQPQRGATIFGDVGHAVCERFLLANDRGLGENGHPVDLYPAGWTTMKNRFDKTETLYTVLDTEAALIMSLINKAVVEGVLIREPGREIEKQIETVIYVHGYLKVVLKGFMDLTTARGITDHKFIKNKKYAISKDKLKKSIQMMGYAKERYLSGHKGNIWLTHNNFIKNFEAPEVIQRSVEVTQFEVEQFFNDKILPLVLKMLDYHKRYPKTMIHKWGDIRAADNPNQSCNYHYGHPCPYIGICSGTCSIDNYLMKYGLTINQLVGNVEQPKPKGRPKMSKLLDLIRGQNKTVGTVPATPPVTAPVATQPVPAPAPVAQPAPAPAAVAPAANLVPATALAAAPAPAPVEKQKAPWYSEYNGEPCGACKDNPVLGYNSRMEPCRICDARASAEGRPQSLQYDVEPLDGLLKFSLRGTTEIATVAVAPQPQAQTLIAPAETLPTLNITKVVPPTVEHIQVTGTFDPPAEAPPTQPVTPSTQMGTVFDVLPTAAEAGAALCGVGAGLPSAQTEPWTSPEARIATNHVAEAKGAAPPESSGYSLLIGCTYSKAAADAVPPTYIEDILEQMLVEIAAAADKAHYSAIEHFALMQAVDAYVPLLLPNLEGVEIVSSIPSKGSAHARLIDGLKLHAATVIQPFAV